MISRRTEISRKRFFMNSLKTRAIESGIFYKIDKKKFLRIFWGEDVTMVLIIVFIASIKEYSIYLYNTKTQQQYIRLVYKRKSFTRNYFKIMLSEIFNTAQKIIDENRANHL